MQSPLEALERALEQGDLAAARAATQALRRAVTPTTQLAAEVLHELRQPLLGVKAYAQMLLLEEDASAPPGPLGLLLEQVERMEQIISDFTRLASSRPAPKEKLSLAAHVRNARKLFTLDPQSARVVLDVDVTEDLELQGNGRLLEQLVVNLLSNARDAMSGMGRIKVLLTRESGVPTLYVADWGPGIPPEIKDRIFQPYVTSKSRGSGLGLAVCQRIAEEHRARIELVDPSCLSEHPPAATVFRVTFNDGPVRPGPRRRLLVVDDEPIIRMVFKDLLGKECEVVDAESAEEGLAQLRAKRFDLIVADKNLPGLSGIELAREARRLDPTSKLILMTGYPSLTTAQQALELGVMDYLLKPFDDIREVRSKIRQLLEAPPPKRYASQSRRVDVYEENPAAAQRLQEALDLLGLSACVLTELKPGGDEPPLGLLISWDFAHGRGERAVDLGKTIGRGAPFVVLAEHLSMEIAIDSLRGGAAACLPKLLGDVKVLSRELARALRLPGPATPTISAPLG